jgi:hypothetical protein
MLFALTHSISQIETYLHSPIALRGVTFVRHLIIRLAPYHPLLRYRPSAKVALDPCFLFRSPTSQPVMLRTVACRRAIVHFL